MNPRLSRRACAAPDLTPTVPDGTHRRSGRRLCQQQLLFLGEGGDPRDPLASPLYADLSGLGPIDNQAGGDETQLDDARRHAEHARRAGVDTRLDVFPDMLHTFQMAAGRAPEADEAIRRMATWVRPKLGL
jgi:monoterpene epsilon-lactone hydrolase